MNPPSALGLPPIRSESTKASSSSSSPVSGGAQAAILALLEEEHVTDVLINGDGQVWVDGVGGLRRQGLRIPAPRELAVRLAAMAGQRLDDASPIVDGRLPSGARLHALLEPLSIGGATVSLRQHHRLGGDLQAMRAGGLIDGGTSAVIHALVSARVNVVVSGATGTGKTTLLAAALSVVDPGERIICVEEAHELQPRHPHVVNLQARAANIQSAGEVSLAELVRAGLRMRPDRLILGECRGAELREVMSAMNTGHEGGWVTLHANSADDVPARLLALGSLAGLGADSVARQARAAFDVVLHLNRRGGLRRLDQVALLHGDPLTCEPLFERRENGWYENTSALKHLHSPPAWCGQLRRALREAPESTTRAESFTRPSAMLAE